MSAETGLFRDSFGDMFESQPLLLPAELPLAGRTRAVVPTGPRR